MNARFQITGDRVRVLPGPPGHRARQERRARGDHRGRVLTRPARRRHPADRHPGRDPGGRAHVARHHAEGLVLHHGHGRLVLEPHLERAADGALHRRDDHRAGRGLLVQPRRRPAHGGARFPRGPDDRRPLLLPSIGGGVCQTATTLFNNAFELGLPIVERHNHSFYISHYPLGRDATVSWGGPDFEFRNDLTDGILIKSSYTSSTLTFTFYGTPSGRRVVSTTSPQTNWRQPKTSYAYDPYAPAGSIRTSEGSNAAGFDVTVHRTVYPGRRSTDARLVRRAATSRSAKPRSTAPGRPRPVLRLHAPAAGGYSASALPGSDASDAHRRT